MYLSIAFDAGYVAEIALVQTPEQTEVLAYSGSWMGVVPNGATNFEIHVGIGNDANQINATLWTAYVEVLD